ncbi:unnamed protein product [Symbiodinium sp. KB8]|nr:unnamed protein product [Symbiodinium sp. KB8]
MDMDLEHLEPVGGIPMPPEAWELLSIWSEVWDAPRFRAHGLASARLSREAVMPLLKLAASCVAAVRSHLQGSSAALTVPLHGASRELLVAAADAESKGKGLPDPRRNPVDFVHELVHAAFLTGDGEYADGMSEVQIDELMKTCCEAQLEFGKSLTRNPTVALEAAYSKLQEIVREVLEAPPEEGDLAGVAGRWMLAGQLRRVAEDAALLVPTKREQSQGEIEAEVDESTVSHTDVEMDSEVSKPTEGDEDSEPPLKRTKSQVAATLKVQKVKEHQENMLKEVHDLARTTSMLAKHEVPANQAEKLRAELVAVGEARKKARNFGEDLLEDMMVLDNLSKLTPEDRSLRKATIAGLEGLLQNVDTAKSRLATLHRKLEDNLKNLETKERERKEQEQLEQAAPEVLPAVSKPGAVAMSVLEPPPPDQDMWKQVRLPLRFHAREEDGQYVLSATAPGLCPDDLKLELNHDATTLKVEGLRLPTQKEEDKMRRRIAKKIRETAERSPEKFEVLAKRLPDVAADAYVELGQAQYGRFAEAFRLPHDVDVESIDASYTDGILRVVLPKRPRRALPQGLGYNSLGSRSGRGDVYPGLGLGSAGRWGDSLFGGHDDYFRW